jgi:hypothetical protein
MNICEKFIMDNNDNFECLLIKPNNIKDISWLNLEYPKIISELDTYETLITNCDNFIEIIATKLETDKFNIPNLSIKNEIIAESKDYFYELLYIDLLDYKDYHNVENEVATLLNINGDIIYSNALLLKNYLPSLTDSITIVDAKKIDIQNILSNRVNTKIVTWDYDNNWKEIEVIGDLNYFAKNFFEDCDYQKIEFAFLLHNINIWYITDNYGEKNVCGTFISKPIEKCLLFTMNTNELRGNLTLDEVKKIIFLSDKVNSYKTPSELLEEKNDNLGRKIINNKYKILDYMYHKF